MNKQGDTFAGHKARLISICHQHGALSLDNSNSMSEGVGIVFRRACAAASGIMFLL